MPSNSPSLAAALLQRRLRCMQKLYRERESMLTTQQETFAQNIIMGMSQAEAYRNAYNTNKMTDKTVWEKASRLMATDKVRARVSSLLLRSY